MLASAQKQSPVQLLDGPVDPVSVVKSYRKEGPTRGKLGNGIVGLSFSVPTSLVPSDNDSAVASEELTAKIPMYIPRTYRKFDSYEEVQEVLGPAIEDLTNWLLEHLPYILEDPDTARILAEDAIYTVVFLCPNLELDGKPSFLCRIRQVALLLFIDMVIDNPDQTGGRVQWVPDPHSSEHQGFLKQLEAVARNDSEDVEEHLMEILFRSGYLHENPLLATFMAACYETMGSEEDESLTRRWFLEGINFKRSLRCAQMLSGDPLKFSLDTFRYLRYGQSGSLPLAAYEKTQKISEDVKDHPFYDLFNALGSKVMGMFNDVLGIEKDIKEKEYNGNVITQRVLRGENLRKAWEEEIQMLQDAIKEYIGVREHLLEAFPLDESLLSYVEIMDSVIFGSLQQIPLSPKYGIIDKVNISGI